LLQALLIIPLVTTSYPRDPQKIIAKSGDHTLTITQDELARAVAAEMGGEVAEETNKTLRGETSRAFGLTEAMTVAAFITQAAQLAMQIYQASQDRAALATRLTAEAPPSPKLDAAKRQRIITRIVDTLTGH
jgi:hypothetical protein